MTSLRIAVVAPAAVPYTRGGYERLWTGVVNHLNERTDHRAELIKLPFPETTLHEVIDGYRRFSELDVGGFDLVLTGKYPGWMVRHPRHVIYLAHTLRGLYDTYPVEWVHCSDPRAEDARIRLGGIPESADIDTVLEIYSSLVTELGADHPDFAHPGPLGRALVHALDRIGMSPQRVVRHSAISHTVARREGYFPPGVGVEVMLPPTTLELTPKAGGEYFFTASRLDDPKRIEMIIAAMSAVEGDTPLLIAGTGPARERLESAAADDPRIRFLGFVPDDELTSLYAGALAVPFVPRDEDYGLITVEALGCGTPVVTTSDSGGPTEIVRDGANGFVCEPDGRSLGRVMNALANNPDLSTAMSAHCVDSVADINWPNLGRFLTRATPGPRHHPAPARAGGRPRLVLLSTYPIHDPRGGGQLRCFHLYRHLTESFDIDFVTLTDVDSPEWTASAEPGLTETAVPRSRAHHDAEVAASVHAGVPVSDLLGGSRIALTPRYLSVLHERLRGAAAVVLIQPYMLPALDIAGCELPVVLDNQNVEAVLKDQMYLSGPEADLVRAQVSRVEAAALSRARLSIACSQEDADLLQRLYPAAGGPSVVIPNGVDLDHLDFVDPRERVTRRLRWAEAYGDSEGELRLGLFIASWHSPNLRAAEWIHEMAPGMPEVRFLMAGSHTQAFDPATLPPNVIQLGVIGDATKHILLGTVDVALNPMLEGSGTNLKMVEYLAAGIPTVSTSFGGRGVAPADSGFYRVAGEDEFADLIADTVQREPTDPHLTRMVRRAQEHVRARFDWSVLAGRLTPHLEKLVRAD